jgi:hypothetical protein
VNEKALVGSKGFEQGQTQGAWEVPSTRARFLRKNLCLLFPILESDR